MKKQITRLEVQQLPTGMIVWIVVMMAVLATVPAWSAGFTRNFRLEDCTWSSKGAKNPYFSLVPGTRSILEGEEDGEDIKVKITVKNNTKQITFETQNGNTLTVKARVVEEREWEDGELVEVSRNWFARCKETSDVYYFGESVDDYEDGEIVGHGGEWRAGVDGALPGIIMPATYLLGAKYFQEIAPGVALDRAKHVDMDLDVSLPAGDFSECVAVQETSPLDAGAESFKIYCPGVGLVLDDLVPLVSRRTPK